MRQTMRSFLAVHMAWAPLVSAQVRSCTTYKFGAGSSWGAIFPTGATSMDWGDAQSGSGFCASLLAAGGLSCASTFAPDMAQAGYCDHSCGFCRPADMLPSLPSCLTYAFPTDYNRGVSVAKDYYDAWTPNGCNQILANEKTSCDTTFSPTGSMPHHCDSTCGYCKAVPPFAHNSPTANMGAAQACRSAICKPVAPVWARLAGAGGSTPNDFWDSPDDCVDFVTLNGGSVMVPSHLPNSPPSDVYTVYAPACATTVPNWMISFGFDSEAECMARCDLPGCISDNAAVCCGPHRAAGCPAPPPPPQPPSPPPAPPPPPPAAAGSHQTAEFALPIGILLLVGLAAGLKAKGKLPVLGGKGPGGEALSENIYEEAGL